LELKALHKATTLLHSHLTTYNFIALNWTLRIWVETLTKSGAKAPPYGKAICVTTPTPITYTIKLMERPHPKP